MVARTPGGPGTADIFSRLAMPFWALLKEEISSRIWPDRANGRAEVFAFIETFDNRRCLRKHKSSATSPQPRPGNGTNTASRHRDRVSKIAGELLQPYSKEVLAQRSRLGDQYDIVRPAKAADVAQGVLVDSHEVRGLPRLQGAQSVVDPEEPGRDERA